MVAILSWPQNIKHALMNWYGPNAYQIYITIYRTVCKLPFYTHREMSQAPYHSHLQSFATPPSASRR